MQPLEKNIEKKVCDYAKERGLLVYKFTSPARAAVPDRLFIVPHVGVFFIEFKRPGVKATAPQLREHGRLRDVGIRVYVVDDIAYGKNVIDYETKLIVHAKENKT